MLSARHVLALAAAAGLNPWLTLLIVAGLAAFTTRAPLGAPFDSLAARPMLTLLALLLGVDVVLGKVRRVREPVIWAAHVAAPLAGALLCAGLSNTLAARGLWQAGLVGAALGLAVRAARQWVSASLDVRLRPFGPIAAAVAANVVAGGLIATAFLLR